MTRESAMNTAQVLSEADLAAVTSGPSDRQQVIRAIVGRPRQHLATTIRRHDEDGRLDTADPAGPTLRTSPHELKVIDLPKFQPLEGGRDSMASMQEWEGVVTAVEGDTVFADLIDITAKSHHVNESAELPLSEFNPEDRAGIRRGTIFRWAIGYVRTEAGMRLGASVLRLRHGRQPVAILQPLAFEPD